MGVRSTGVAVAQRITQCLSSRGATYREALPGQRPPTASYVTGRYGVTAPKSDQQTQQLRYDFALGPTLEALPDLAHVRAYRVQAQPAALSVLS